MYFWKLQTFQYLLPLFRFEVSVLLSDIICDVFLCWLSREQKDVAVMAFYLCQARMCVLLISKEADSVQDSANPISVAILYCLFFWNDKDGPRNTQDFS
jgi:hypothetical protein